MILYDNEISRLAISTLRQNQNSKWFYLMSNSSIIQRIDFFDSDFLQSAVNNTKLTYKQVTKGKFKGTLKRTALANMVVDRGSYNLKLISEGETSKDTVTILIVEQSNEAGRLWGQDMKGADIITILPGTEIESTVPSGAIWSSIDIDKTTLHEYGLRTIKNEIFRIDSKRFQYFIHHFNRINAMISINTYSNVVLQDQLLSLCTQTIEHADNTVKLSYKDSSLIALNIRDYLHEHLTESLQMKQLCILTGKSVRTVERVFKQFFNLSVQEYHTYHRFLLVRQTLLHDKHIPISNIAFRYGFFHLGRFAAKYKEVFGELPSQTFRQN